MQDLTSRSTTETQAAEPQALAKTASLPATPARDGLVERQIQRFLGLLSGPSRSPSSPLFLEALGLPSPASGQARYQRTPADALPPVPRAGAVPEEAPRRAVPPKARETGRKQDLDLAQTVAAVLGQLGVAERERLFLSCSAEEWRLLEACAHLKTPPP